MGKGLIYRPIVLEVDQQLADSTDYTAEHIEAPAPGHTITPPIDGASTKRYFEITRSPSTPINSGTVTLSYGSDDGVTDPSGLRILKDDGAGNWLNLGGTGTGTPAVASASTPQFTITSTVNFTSFSDFALGDETVNPLPVELVDFSASLNPQNVMLNWQSAAEISLDGYVVERSADGEVYEPIAFQQANGSRSAGAAYQHTDTKAYDQGVTTLYYRLKMLDQNGEFEYSKTVAVVLKAHADLAVRVWPNPFEGQLNIQVPATAQSQMLVVDLMDIAGKKLITQTLSTGNTAQTVSLNQVANLPSGWYLVVVQSQQTRQIFKVKK